MIEEVKKRDDPGKMPGQCSARKSKKSASSNSESSVPINYLRAP